MTGCRNERQHAYGPVRAGACPPARVRTGPGVGRGARRDAARGPGPDLRGRCTRGRAHRADPGPCSHGPTDRRPIRFTAPVDPAATTWAVLRIADPARESDAPGPDGHPCNNFEVAYASPFSLAGARPRRSSGPRRRRHGGSMGKRCSSAHTTRPRGTAARWRSGPGRLCPGRSARALVAIRARSRCVQGCRYRGWSLQCCLQWRPSRCWCRGCRCGWACRCRPEVLQSGGRMADGCHRTRARARGDRRVTA